MDGMMHALIFDRAVTLLEEYSSVVRQPAVIAFTPSMPAVSVSEIKLLKTAYAAFNARDIDGALATMTLDVTWPKAFKGGFVRGPEEIRAYWTEQWREIDPHVDPLEFFADDKGRVLVHVHQVVRDLSGNVMADVRVGHRFLMREGRIAGMEIASLPTDSTAS